MAKAEAKEKYPVKDPFVELVKGSLNTFLNAMTYPDKTVYPVASRNDKDFQNLMDVYLDAVFHPNIYRHPEILKQEGWSYKIENPEDPVIYNGVVYNEMKGVYSSADAFLEREAMQALFPDNCYKYESGGFGEKVREFIDKAGIKTELYTVTLPDEYVEHGNVDILKKEVRIDAESIIEDCKLL